MTDRNRSTAQFRRPAPEDMSALIAAAHRARMRYMKLLFRMGVRAVKRYAARFTSVPAARKMSHA